MTLSEGQNFIEKSPAESVKKEEQKISTVKDLDSFYQDSAKKIQEIAGQDEAKKDGPAKILLDMLQSRIQALKEKYGDAISDYQQEVDALKREVSRQLLRFQNRKDLQKMLGRAEPPENIPDGGKKEFRFIPQGAADFVTIEVTDTFQITSAIIAGKNLKLQQNMEVPGFQKVMRLMGKILARMDALEPPVPPETEITVEDVNRYTFVHENIQYKIISDGIDGVSLYKIKSSKNAASGEVTMVDEDGQQVVETSSANGFTLDMFTKTGGVLGKKAYRDGLCVEESYAPQFGGSKIERSVTSSGDVRIRKYVPGGSDSQFTLTEDSLIHENGDLVDSRIIDHGKVRVLTLAGPPRTSEYYSDSGKILFRVEKGTNKAVTFVSPNGVEVSDFATERKNNPQLKPDAYMTALARVIQTPEQWQAFTEHFMRYEYDSPDPNDPQKVGTLTHHGDYWQSPEETVARVEKGHTLGDCDDYAFLAQRIMEKQGKKSFVVEVPGHAICAWLQKRPDGRYDAYSVCTYGYDKNGSLGMPPDPQKEAGFSTPQEAFNAMVSKYSVPRVGVDKPIHYKVTDGNVTVLSIPSKGEKQRELISVADMVVS